MLPLSWLILAIFAMEDSSNSSMHRKPGMTGVIGRDCLMAISLYKLVISSVGSHFLKGQSISRVRVSQGLVLM
jgi:hypothetical protein